MARPIERGERGRWSLRQVALASGIPSPTLKLLERDGVLDAAHLTAGDIVVAQVCTRIREASVEETGRRRRAAASALRAALAIGLPPTAFLMLQGERCAVYRDRLEAFAAVDPDSSDEITLLPVVRWREEHEAQLGSPLSSARRSV